MDRYAVFGNPIGHSKSPAIHRRFAAETGQLLSYEARLSPLDGFGEAVRQFVESGGCGFNVTVPFKEEAFELADELTLRAERARAVNTIEVLESGKLRGDNTDGIGLIRDLSQNHSVPLSAVSTRIIRLRSNSMPLMLGRGTPSTKDMPSTMPTMSSLTRMGSPVGLEASKLKL